MLDDGGRDPARIRRPSPRGSYDARSRRSRRWWRIWSARAVPRRASASGFPGTISPATGLVKNANSTWLIGRPLGRDVERALGRPVRFANDANCFALSEATDGAAAGAASSSASSSAPASAAGSSWTAGDRRANAIAGEWGTTRCRGRAKANGPGRRATAAGRAASRRSSRGRALRVDFECGPASARRRGDRPRAAARRRRTRRHARSATKIGSRARSRPSSTCSTRT